MGLENFAFYFPLREVFGDPLSTVDLGLVTCEPGTDRQVLQQQLQATVGEHIRVYTREELVDKEITVWDRNTPIGVIFRVGMIMGFRIEILICYQVLYNDIADHMAEFATLVAMGYGQLYFVGVVVREAFYLSFARIHPRPLHRLGALPVDHDLDRFDDGVIAAEHCLHLGADRAHVRHVRLLAVRKLLATDPASLF